MFKRYRQITVFGNPKLAASLRDLTGLAVTEASSDLGRTVLESATLPVLSPSGAWPHVVVESAEQIRCLGAAGARHVGLFVRGEVRFVRPVEVPLFRLLAAVDRQACSLSHPFAQRLVASLLVLPLRMALDLVQIARWPTAFGDFISLGNPAVHYWPWYQGVALFQSEKGFLGTNTVAGRGTELGAPFWFSPAYSLLRRLGVRWFLILHYFSATILMTAIALRMGDLLALTLVVTPFWACAWLKESKPSQLGWLLLFAGLTFPVPALPTLAAVAVAGMSPLILGGPLLIGKIFLDGSGFQSVVAFYLLAASGLMLWWRLFQMNTTQFGYGRYQSDLHDAAVRVRRGFLGMPPLARELFLAEFALLVIGLMSGSSPLVLLLAWPMALHLAEARGTRLADYLEHQLLFFDAILIIWPAATTTWRATAVLITFLLGVPIWGYLPWGAWDFERQWRPLLKVIPSGSRMIEECYTPPTLSEEIRAIPYLVRSYLLPLGRLFMNAGLSPISGLGFFEMSHTAFHAYRDFSINASEVRFSRALAFFRPECVVAFTPEFCRRLERHGGIHLGSVNPDINGYFPGMEKAGRCLVPHMPSLYRMASLSLIEPVLPHLEKSSIISFDAPEKGEYRVRINATLAWRAFQDGRELRIWCENGDLGMEVPAAGVVILHHRWRWLFRGFGLVDRSNQRLSIKDLPAMIFCPPPG